MGPMLSDRAMSSPTGPRVDLKVLIIQTVTQHLVGKVALPMPRLYPSHRHPRRLLTMTDPSDTATLLGDRTSITLMSPAQLTNLQDTTGIEARQGEAVTTAKLAILTSEHRLLPPHRRAAVTSPLDLAHPAVRVVVAASCGRVVLMINRKMTIRKESLIIVVLSLVGRLRRPKAVRSVISVLSLILPVTHRQAVEAVVEVNGKRCRYRAKVLVGKMALSAFKCYFCSFLLCICLF